MPAQVLDGKLLAQRIRTRLAEARAKLGARPVRLVSLEVGQSPAAASYVRNQQRAAAEVGIEMEIANLPATTNQADTIAAIQRYNARPEVAGIIVQRPLPAGIDARAINEAIAPHKDAEGMHPQNLGAILLREVPLAPCTAAAAQELILSSGVPLRGAEAVVVGRSEIVGKPVAMLLLHHQATVTVCHSNTKDLAAHTRGADILVVAVGKAGLVRGNMIKPGACVIDVGINQGADGKLVGDVEFATAMEIAGFLTPVPGGVGPVAVAMLLRNTLRAAGAAV